MTEQMQLVCSQPCNGLLLLPPGIFSSWSLLFLSYAFFLFPAYIYYQSCFFPFAAILCYWKSPTCFTFSHFSHGHLITTYRCLKKEEIFQ